MPTGTIDLHCHSTASDGRLTPAQLVEHAIQLGLKAVALTDHDTIAGLGLFHSAGRAHGLETVSGVEISCECHEKGVMHMVGLFVDAENQQFRAFLRQLADGRIARNPQIVRKLKDLGFAITMDEVEQEAAAWRAASAEPAGGRVIGRPHIAAVLIRKGYVKDKQDAFDRYLAKGRAAYVPRFVASPEDSIAQIRQANGLAILAHPPYLQAQSDAELERIIVGLKARGLDGIEVYFSTHTAQQTALLERLAARHDLAVSGGTDFHGERGRGGKDVELGRGVGRTLAIPYTVLEKLKERRVRR